MFRLIHRATLSLLATLLSLPALAVTYQYTGPNFTSVSNFTPPCPATSVCANYAVGMRITGSFSTAAPLPAGFAGSVVGSITSYSFSDGVNTIASTGSGSRLSGFYLRTDSSGAIIYAQIGLQQWQRGAGTHAVGDKYNNIYLNSPGSSHAGVNSFTCMAVGISPAGAADACTQPGEGIDGSSALVNPGTGVWTLAPPARVGSYFDLWWNPAEAGWGVQVVQSNTFQFLTLFIYGADGNPTWYTAELDTDAAGNFTGPLYANTGPYFAGPWDPARVTSAAVGTASFQPIDAYHATLTYSLAGGPAVKKAIQRESLTPLMLAGNYSGSISGTVSGCDNPANNKPAVRGRFGLAVTQDGEQTATLGFSFVDETYDGIVCTLTGPLTHLGGLYRMAGAQYSCTGTGITPGTVSATVERFHPTQQGIEGAWTATAGGCTQSISFAAVEN